jgi:predicted nucleotidyltransferase
MELISKHIEELNALCEKHKVKELYAFGSIISGPFKNSSDLDFLVEFEHIDLYDYFDNYMDLKESLEELFDIKVDLLEIQTLKNPILKRSINRNKKLIYGRTDSKMVV